MARTDQPPGDEAQPEVEVFHPRGVGAVAADPLPGLAPECGAVVEELWVMMSVSVRSLAGMFFRATPEFWTKV